MGYRIDYGNNAVRRDFVKKNGINKFILRGVLISICFCVAAFFLHANINTIIELAIPGDAGMTKMAFAAFMDNLQDGCSLSEAIKLFCREIIANA